MIAGLTPLREAAACGDIRGIRTQLANLRAAGGFPSAVLDHLESLSASYQVDQLRRQLDELTSARSPA